jgi:4'-phosphopantetheinyl transferase EntD
MLPWAEVEGLFEGAEVLVLSAEIDARALALVTPAEAALVERAVDKRKREFATARVLAREGMARLGLPGVELLNGADRAPIWPSELSGSISHCDSRAVVAVARRALAGTVGVDVEHRDELKRELWKTVFLPEEVAALDAGFDGALRGRAALALFSAKEALYKAQYPWSVRFMGFRELRVTLLPDPSVDGRGGIACEFQNDVGPFARGAVARGRYRLDAFPAGEVVTAVRIEPSLPRADTSPAPASTR